MTIRETSHRGLPTSASAPVGFSLLLTLLAATLVVPTPAAAQAPESAGAADAVTATTPSTDATEPAPAKMTARELEEKLEPLPSPDLAPLEASVRDVILLRREALNAHIADGTVAPIAEAFGELGFLFHAHGLWPAAIACYRNAEALLPEDPRWSYSTALALRDSNDLEAAAAAYEHALDVLPRNPAAIIALAEIRLEQNQPEWAKALLRYALEVVPESPAGLAVLGQVALSQKRYAKAVTYFERSHSQQPAATRLHYPRALAYRGLGDVEKAKENLALRGEAGVRPPDPIQDEINERKTGERVMLLEGRRAFAARDFQAAAAFFQRAVEADPESSRALVNLASAQAMAGNPQAAVENYRVVLEREPENASALFNLGVLLMQAGQRDQALPLLEQAAAADPDDAEARLELAKVKTQDGDLQAALGWAEEALNADRSMQSAWTYAAQIEVALGRWKEARERLEDAARQIPGQGLIIHELARLLAASLDVSQRDGEMAVNLASSVAQAAPTPQYLETLALALGEAGRCDEALQVQELAIERAAGTPVADRLKNDLARYQNGPPCRPPFAGGS
ncbi:MAG: tetratricopeptide repeat protein [Acidobacteriota bacterium]